MKQLIDNIDPKRGNIPRNLVVESLILKGVKFGTISSCPQKQLESKEGDAGAISYGQTMH